MTTHEQFSAQLGLFPGYIAREQEKLELKEKISLSGSDSTVTMVDGRKLLQVEGKAWSMSAQMNVRDGQGRDLFTIRKHVWNWLVPSYNLEDVAGNKICEVSGSWGWAHVKAKCTFVSIGGKSETLSLRGNWKQTGAEIKHEPTGQTVANITRTITARDLIGNRQSYTISVAPNVDMALIVAMCVCLDDRTTNIS